MNTKKRIIYLSICVGFVMVSGYAVYAYGHKTFQKTTTGLAYRVVDKGAGPRPQEGEVMLINVHCKSCKGKSLLNTESQGMPMAMPYSKDKVEQDGGVMEAVNMLQKGGKLLCKLDATKVFGENWAQIAQKNNLKQDSKVLLSLHLQDIMTKEEHQKWEKEQIAMLQQEEAMKQLQEDTKIITNYLAEHQITAETTPSGLFYVIDKPGQGIQPKPASTVKVNYTGKLLNGKVFDTSVEEAAKQHGVHNPHRPYEPLSFQLGVGQVIPGWDEGISLLQKGSKARLFIPSTLAYGKQGAGGLIPANAVLIFEVELVDFKS